MQEIGRCGRDGNPAMSVLYYNNTDIASNLEHLQDEMRQYVKTTECRREFILKYFGFENDSADPHKCCDNCLSSCVCDICKESKIIEKEEVHGEKFSSEKRIIAKDMLDQYFTAENDCVEQFLPQLHTGLSESLSDSISKSSVYSNIDKISADFPSLKDDYVHNIAEIIKTVQSMEIRSSYLTFSVSLFDFFAKFRNSKVLQNCLIKVSQTYLCN